jgi:hypothetical protein
MSKTRMLVDWDLTSESFALLRSEFSELEPITSFAKNPKFAALVASLGLCHEIGTVNDELAPLLFDANTGVAVPLTSMKAKLVKLGDLTGVGI